MGTSKSMRVSYSTMHGWLVRMKDAYRKGGLTRSTLAKNDNWTSV